MHAPQFQLFPGEFKPQSYVHFLRWLRRFRNQRRGRRSLWFGYLGTLHEVPGSSVGFRINWLRSGPAEPKVSSKQIHSASLLSFHLRGKCQAVKY